MTPLLPWDAPLWRGADLKCRDIPRLESGLARTIEVMRDGAWRTKPAIRQAINALLGADVCEESIARYLRYAKELGWTLERRRVAGGLYEYRIERSA